MDQFIIKAMVKALKPTLKDPRRAEQILEQVLARTKWLWSGMCRMFTRRPTKGKSP